jgi:hypothetical protein
MIYAQRNFLIRFLSLKKYIARKYRGITNQSRDKRNLKDTTGIELVMLVINNQNKLIKTAIDTGCLNIFLSIVRPIENFNIKININPTNIGSVGIDISTGVLGTYSDNKIESGVKKTVTRKTSFKSVKIYQTISKMKGIKTP